MTETTIVEPICITYKHKEPSKNHLDKIILEAIAETLGSFGDAVRKVVYSQLQNNYNVPNQEIPDKIDEFAATIEEVFGICAPLIEMKIIKTLYAKAAGFIYVPRDENLLFKDYVQNLRSYLANSTTN